MRQSVSILKNIHARRTAYILGSGSSMNFYDKDFFNNHLTIGVNMIYEFFRCDYVVIHHHQVAQQILDADQVLVISEHDVCINKREKHQLSKDDFYFEYKHNDQSYTKLDISPLFDDDPDKILTGGTTIINAVGLAVHMGVKRIILVGCDNGSLDGKTNIDGYYQEQDQGQYKQQQGHSIRSNVLMIQLRDVLKTMGIQMVSLSPFMGLGTEKHIYSNKI